MEQVQKYVELSYLNTTLTYKLKNKQTKIKQHFQEKVLFLKFNADYNFECSLVNMLYFQEKEIRKETEKWRRKKKPV